MKTLELTGTGLDSLTLVTRPTPRIGPRDLLLRQRAAALNYRDLSIARGEYGAFARPLVLGSDAVSEVVQVGPEVTRFRPGDRVCPIDTPDWLAGPPEERALQRRLGGPMDGVLTELMAVSEEAAVAAPRHLSDPEAAALCGAGVTAWQVLYGASRVAPGETVVVQGTGGVSLFALQLARLGGARVIATSRSAEKLARLQALGAAEVVDTRARPDWDQEVLRLTDGRGADLVVDVIGGGALARSIAACRVGGTVAVLGFLDGRVSPLDLPAAIRRAVTLRTWSGRSREAFEALVRAMESSGLRPVIDRVFELERAREAFEHLASGTLFGKVALRFPGPAASPAGVEAE
jgi:NADPH:quinone reductase-like Zn-dependent oxidoreductase